MKKLLIAFAATSVALVFSASALAGSSGSPPKPADRSIDGKSTVASKLSTPKIPSAVLEQSAAKK